MAVMSSLFIKDKCNRVYGTPKKYCVYFADILLSAIIILLLIPQILVVSTNALQGTMLCVDYSALCKVQCFVLITVPCAAMPCADYNPVCCY